MLRSALKLDAVVTGVNGTAYVVAAIPLGELFGIAPGLLRAAGVFLVAFAALVWLTGTRPAIPRGAVAAIVAANAVWALDSTVAALSGWGSPSTVGGCGASRRQASWVASPPSSSPRCAARSAR